MSGPGSAPATRAAPEEGRSSPAAGITGEDANRPPWPAAAITAAAVFLLYAATLAPTTGFWDASEYIATAYVLGIPHPPGNPLFVALARSWIVLLSPLDLSVAVRVNLLAATTSAVASGFFFLVAHRILRKVVTRRWVRVAGAAAATVTGATAFTVWHQSTVNEKVYTVSVAIIAAVSWLALRWWDRREEAGSERYLLVAGYLMVLGSTNHLMSLLPAPALALLVLVGGAGVLTTRRFWVRAVPLVVLGLSFNFFLPIRAAQEPVINEGEPTCESVAGATAAVYTNGLTGCPALAASLQREQYAKPPLTERMAPFRAQLLNWFQYFDWQWARGAAAEETPGNARLSFTLLFLGLGLVGLWATWKADRGAFLYLGALVVVLTLGLVFYLNFKYGYSLYPEITDLDSHEVRERDYFFVAGFMLWGVLAGIGLTWAWTTVARQLRWARAHLLTAPILGVALIPLVMNWAWASRSGEWAARTWAYDLLTSVEPYGILFTNGDNDTFPLWYLQEVEGVRRDVTVIVGQYLYTDWYPRQLRRLTGPERQRPFEPEEAVGPYASRPSPRDPVLDSNPSELDRIGSGRLGRDMTVPFPGIAVTYPAGVFLDRSQRLALSVIHDSIDERPIYFAGTAGMMSRLGLARWSVRQGLAAKLVFRDLDEPPPEGVVRTSENLLAEWFDWERSRTLYEEVYRFRGLRAVDVWTDRSTLNIPWQYYALALQLADVGAARGMSAEWRAVLEGDARAFRVTANGGRKGTPEGEGD